MVYLSGGEASPGTLRRVQITQASDYDLVGELDDGQPDGVPGAGDLVIQSKLPLSLDAKLPVEVTSGDSIELPISLTNETDGAVDADLNAQFGAAFKLAGGGPDVMRDGGALHPVSLEGR